MKKSQRLSLAVVLALSVAAIPLVRAQGMGGMDMKDMDMGKDKKAAGKKSESKTHKGVGTVKKVDSAAGKVTIAHGPIPTMKWPAMNMTFTVKDKKALEALAPEKKVEFQFIEQGSDYIITSIK